MPSSAATWMACATHALVNQLEHRRRGGGRPLMKSIEMVAKTLDHTGHFGGWNHDMSWHRVSLTFTKKPPSLRRHGAHVQKRSIPARHRPLQSSCREPTARSAQARKAKPPPSKSAVPNAGAEGIGAEGFSSVPHGQVSAFSAK